MFFLLLAQLQTRTRHTLTHPHTHSLSALHLRSLVRGKGVHGNTTHIHTHTHTHPPLHSHTLTHGYRSQKPAHLSHGPMHAVKWHAQIIPVKHACTHWEMPTKLGDNAWLAVAVQPSVCAKSCTTGNWREATALLARAPFVQSCVGQSWPWQS